MLLSSLEHLPSPERVLLGKELINRLKEEPSNKSYLWALGRVGARVPLYGPINCLVPAETAREWAEFLLSFQEISPHAAQAIVQLLAMTNDPLRDVEREVRETAVEKLSKEGIGTELTESLKTYLPPTYAGAARIFGESLPAGLRLLG
jgi:hypothetical protein